MFYEFVKVIARFAIRIYCRHLQINKKDLLKVDGPLLLACNHPNSFLDAIILCTLFNRPVYSLARGDVFKNHFIARILLSLKLLPVYRVSEGVENMEENYKTFDQCKAIFRKNGIVLIFSEGKCINEWHLRPLKKGTARLAISSWEQGIKLNVLPVGINYNSFRKFGKNVHIYLGDFITKEDVHPENGYGRAIQNFNLLLRQQLEIFVYEIDDQDHRQRNQVFTRKVPAIKKILLYFPSLIGWLLHVPLILLIKRYIKKKVKDTDHYDSLVVAFLFLSYPIYVLLMTTILFIITRNAYSFWWLFVCPFTAWAFVQLKSQGDEWPGNNALTEPE